MVQWALHDQAHGNEGPPQGGEFIVLFFCFLYLHGHKGIICMLIASVLNSPLTACQKGLSEFPTDDCF